MTDATTIGIDLGGTNMRAGLVKGRELASIKSQKIKKDGSAAEIVEQLFALTDGLTDGSVQAIGIGVPGLVHEESGTVFDVINIPSWQKVPLKQVM
jgi:glucokinase